MQGLLRIWKDLQDFGRGFARFHDTLGEDLHIFMRLWERIHKYSLEFGRGLARICKTLLKYSQGFVRIWESICKTLGEDL